MASQLDFKIEDLKLDNIIGFLIEKFNIASREYEKSQTEFLCYLPDGIEQPLLRSNAISIYQPWLLSRHYNLEHYDLNSDIGIFCKNFNIQTDLLITKRRYAFWLYVIKHAQDLFYSKDKSEAEITTAFPAFSYNNSYSAMEDLILDLNYKFTIELCGKEKEMFLYFIHSIIEKPIDWNFYCINALEYFIDISNSLENF